MELLTYNVVCCGGKNKKFVLQFIVSKIQVLYESVTKHSFVGELDRLPCCHIIKNTLCSFRHLISPVLKNSNSEADRHSSWKKKKTYDVVTGRAYKFHCWIQTSVSVLQCQNRPGTLVKVFTYRDTRNKAIAGLRCVSRNLKVTIKLDILLKSKMIPQSEWQLRLIQKWIPKMLKERRHFPDGLLPGNHFQFALTFQNQIRYIISTVTSGSARRCPGIGYSQKTTKGRCHRRHPEQMSEPPQVSTCSSSFDAIMSSATLWRKLISATCICDLSLSVITQLYWE